MDSDYVYVTLGGIEMTADSTAAMGVARNDFCLYLMPS